MKPSLKLIRGKDFELIPERLWRALIQWYGGAPAVRRQVIRNGQGLVELVMSNSQTLKSAARCRSVKKPIRNRSNQMLCVCFEFFDL